MLDKHVIVRAPDGKLISIGPDGVNVDNSAAASPDCHRSMEIKTSRPTFYPSQVGAKIDPAQHGAKIDPTQCGAKIDPAQHGAKIDPVQVGAKIDPAQVGAKIDPAQHGARIDPRASI